MAELNEAFELQKINNVNNPYVMTDKTFYEMNDNEDYTLNITKDLTHNNMQPYFRKKNYGTDYKQTTDIFGDIIDVYDMTQSVIDGSTVKLYYESRLAKVWTNDEVLSEIDTYYNDLEESGAADVTSIEKSKREMSKIKMILEDDDMIDLFARDILNHYDERKGFLNGKAMIVCQTRIAAAKL